MHTTVGLLLAVAASANAYVAPGVMPLAGSRSVRHYPSSSQTPSLLACEACMRGGRHARSRCDLQMALALQWSIGAAGSGTSSIRLDVLCIVRMLPNGGVRAKVGRVISLPSGMQRNFERRYEYWHGREAAWRVD